MFNQIIFGERLKKYRRDKNYTQEEVATKIGVSSQAISKWEKGECLPDVYNLKLLAQFYNRSVDDLLSLEHEKIEKVIEIIKIGGAVFEIIEKPEMFLAGKMIYAKDFKNIHDFHVAIEKANKEQMNDTKISDCVYPIYDIHLSVNFWLDVKERAFGFVRETTNPNQSEEIDVYIIPRSLYVKAYTDKFTAQLIAKEHCEIWELFAYIRNHFMPAHGFKMAENGAQELEVFDTAEHKTGYAYLPVLRI